MNPDQLFEELKLATSRANRQHLVQRGLESGISINEITEMLDYIDYCASVKPEGAAKSKSPSAVKRTRNLSSMVQALVGTLRLR